MFPILRSVPYTPVKNKIVPPRIHMDDIRTNLDSAFKMERDIESGELIEEDDYPYERCRIQHAVQFAIIVLLLIFIGFYFDAPGMIRLPTPYPVV